MAPKGRPRPSSLLRPRQGSLECGITMANYTVTKVRKERSADGTHRHIAGVITDAGTFYPRGQVADSIKAGNAWITSAGGYRAVIAVISYCPRTGCYANPYLRTNPDSTKLDNLENLPEG
jgi:hypothetical protein